MNKKILKLLIICLFLFNILPTLANMDRKIVLNSNVQEVEKIILDVLNMYKGTISIREMNLKEHRYIVDYKDTTVLETIGISNKNWSNDKYIKGSFSCKLTPLNDNKDVLITNVKYSYGLQWVFNHYKKIYKELEFAGKEIVSYKKYSNK